jgi:release factor glutamine methyltransferase
VTILGAITARDQLGEATIRLESAGVETARNDAEWLLADALGLRRGDLWRALDREVRESARARFAAAIDRRARREPLQQILGWEEFCGLRFAVTPDVLVPRPETESLAEWALALVSQVSRPLVIDVGTGSGCLACAVATSRVDARVLALELSPAAARVARANVRGLGLEGRVRVVVADALTAVGQVEADLIVSNPPYLPSAVIADLPPEVRDHEPRLAFDGGQGGVEVVQRIVNAASIRLRPGGAVALETAGGAQTLEVADLLRAAGFARVSLRADLAGVARLVSGVRP